MKTLPPPPSLDTSRKNLAKFIEQTGTSNASEEVKEFVEQNKALEYYLDSQNQSQIKAGKKPFSPEHREALAEAVLKDSSIMAPAVERYREAESKKTLGDQDKGR